MVTLGANGVVYQEESADNVHVPCPKVKAIDTTGAGDAFIGSLACLLADKTLQESFKKKVEIACSVASESVTKLGTQSSYPTSYQM
jgi:ribokinase